MISLEDRLRRLEDEIRQGLGRQYARLPYGGGSGGGETTVVTVSTVASRSREMYTGTVPGGTDVKTFVSVLESPNGQGDTFFVVGDTLIIHKVPQSILEVLIGRSLSGTEEPWVTGHAPLGYV